MADPRDRFVVIGGVPVVNAPQEIDAASAGSFRNIVLHAASSGHAGVVAVNMTGTRFCDSSGVNTLVRAHKQAVAEGGELLLVRPASTAVLRVFAINGLDRLIPHFANLNEALEQAHAVVPRPLQRPATPSCRRWHPRSLTLPARAAAGTSATGSLPPGSSPRRAQLPCQPSAPPGEWLIRANPRGQDRHHHGVPELRRCSGAADTSPGAFPSGEGLAEHDHAPPG
ncbi:MAG: STAS domain-containing protein [Streptosporangiaceae bacterium]